MVVLMAFVDVCWRWLLAAPSDILPPLTRAQQRMRSACGCSAGLLQPLSLAPVHAPLSRLLI
jgi:hypothetical protein